MRTLRTLSLLVVLSLAATASAQDASRMTTERIEFYPGESETSWYTPITDGESHRFLVRVRAGQRLHAHIDNNPGPDDDAPGGAVFQVYAPGRPISARYAAPSEDGSRYDVGWWEGVLSQSGDYQIVVYPRPGGPTTATYALYVSVE